MALFSPTADRSERRSTCDCRLQLHVIRPTCALFTVQGKHDLNAHRAKHKCTDPFRQTPNLMHVLNTYLHTCTGLPNYIHTHTNRCCPEIAGLSCVFCLQRRWLDSDRCWIRRQERDGGKGLALMSCVCVGGRIDEWVAGCISKFVCHLLVLLACVCGWHEGMRKITREAKEREGLIN